MLNPISKLISKIQIDPAETQKSKIKQGPKNRPKKDQNRTKREQKITEMVSKARTKRLGYLVTLYMMK